MSPFELLHYDIWGPTRHKSLFGYSYIVMFVEDYSRITWLFVLKKFSRLFSIFKFPYKEMEVQCGYRVLTLPSNNAQEYMQNVYKIFVIHMGLYTKHLVPIHHNKMVL